MSSKKHKKHKRYIDDLYASKSDGTGFYSGDGTSHRKKNDTPIKKSHIIIGVSLLIALFGAILFLAMSNQNGNKSAGSPIGSSPDSSVASAATETAQQSESSPWFSIDSEGVLYFHSEIFNGNLLVIPKRLNGKAVTKLDGASFSAKNSTVTELTLHEGVKKIGENAFSEFTALKVVNLPHTLERVGAGAFKNTPWYKEKTDEFLIVGSGVLIKYNGRGSTITVPNGVKAIDCGVFEGVNAKKIVTPDSVEYIGNKAFLNCRAESVIISKNLSYCESDAFENCLWLNNRTESFVIEGAGVLLKCNSTEESLYIPDQVYMISSLKPAGLGEKTTLILGQRVRSVSNIEELGLVKAIKVKHGNESLMAQSGVLYSANGSTLYRYPVYKEDTKFYVGKSVLKISNYAFSGTKLSEIELYDGLTMVGERAFSNCPNLKSITLPDTVTSLGTYAFSGSEGLEIATVSENIRTLPHGSFANCPSLASVTLSESLTRISPFSFTGCKNLKSFYIGPKVTDVSPLAFDNNDISFTVSEKNRIYASYKGELTDSNGTANIISPSSSTESAVPFS